MAKPNLTEVYEALRVAEAEGRTDDVAKLIDYIESVQAAPDVATEETFDPRELISSTIPAAGGAIAGAIVPKVIESAINDVKAGRVAAAKPSVTVQGAPLSALADIEEATTKGLSNEITQQTRTAQRAARTEQMEKILAELKAKGIPVNPKILADMEAQYARPGSGILIPVERAREIAAQEAAATKAAPKGSLGQRAVNQFVNPAYSADIANFAKGVYDYKLPLVGSVGSLIGRGLVGAGAGMQGADAYNRYKMGDTTGSVISGLGSLGTAANLIPHPAAKAIGTGVGLSAEAINAYRDAMREGRIEHRAPENYDNIDQMGNAYAQGGLVNLASGGKPMSELPAGFPQITGYKARDNSDDERLFEMGSNPEMVAQDLKQNLAKNINLGDPNYLRGVNTIEADTPMGRGVVGQYAHIDPHKISVRSNMGIPMDTARVVGHEAQHSQEADASKRNYKDYQNDTLLQTARREAAGKGAFDLRKQIDENYKNYVKDYLAKQDEKSGNFGWAMDNGRTLGNYYIDPDIGPHYKFDERFADFAGLESILPRGQRLADTELGKAVFKTPEQASYYYQTVRPLEPKMLPQNPDNESEFIKARRRMAEVAEQNKYKNRGVGSVFLDQLKAAMGKADGGPVQHFQAGRIVKAARELMLPAAENAARTQIIGTLPTYGKAADIFAKQGATGQALDFGAGLGKGADLLGPGTHTYEPFAQGWNPTYTNAKDIPSDAYNRLTNLNVLNVVPRDVRDEMVLDIGRTMEPGGTGIITTRGADVMKAKGRPGPEPTSIITSRDTYQKGFTKQELEDYLRYMLGQGYDINKLNLGPAGAMIQKKAAGGLAHLAEGGQPPKPDANEGAAFIGYRPIQRQEKNKYGAATGFLDALVGAPPSKENILDPRDLAYMQGYEKGEPYGIAAMALPFAGMAAKPLAREIGTRAFMGESLMPKTMRQLVPEMQPAGIIKNEKGGNWLPSELHGLWSPEDQLAEIRPMRSEMMSPDIAKEIGYSPEQIRAYAGNNALDNWINTQLSRYVKNEMGSPDDSIRALADQGILHFKPRPTYDAEGWKNNRYFDADKNRELGGMPEKESALTALGKDWENNVDAAIRPYKIDIPMVEADAGENAWLEKALGKKAHAISDEFMYSNLGFDHMTDVLKEQLASGALRPESMKSLSVPQAVQRVHEYNLAKEKAMQKTALQAEKEMPVVKEYEGGYKWLDLTVPEVKELPQGYTIKHAPDTSGVMAFEVRDPSGKLIADAPTIEEVMASTPIKRMNSQKLKDALKYEGDKMGHCVGGYCEDVIAGNKKIYSLRDAKGEPHVTIEVANAPHNRESLLKLPKEAQDRIAQELYGTESLTMDKVLSNLPAAGQRHSMGVIHDLAKKADELFPNPEKTIEQIKGKQNLAPKSEYQKYVQDFVRSGDWADIGDMQNSGLFDLKGFEKNPNWSHPVTHQIRPEELKALNFEKPTDMVNRLREAYPDQKYLSQDEIRSALGLPLYRPKEK